MKKKIFHVLQFQGKRQHIFEGCIVILTKK
uniref:Uncharacterized protein n=1 Tax=Anguilla anguilla TaxID=7936 RepID=A0A0E9UL01_ANGAN